jgi:glycosyltransferase involved in cell wall biosynthesis
VIGVIIPAHNEEQYLGCCLIAARMAALHPRLGDEPVRIAVVLDACTDASGAIVRAQKVDALVVQARNVGMARAAGAAHLLAAGARWLAFTDADSLVSPDWLVAQLALGADAVCGTVNVNDWKEHTHSARKRFYDSYVDRDGHRHIHGANLGVCAHAYRRAGGFGPAQCSEDVALVQALIRTGARVAWSAAPRVATSARKDSRAPGGFGDTLRGKTDSAHNAHRRQPTLGRDSVRNDINPGFPAPG